MNINIITFFYGNNYGALLQSYYLKKFIEKNFIEKKVSYLDYQPKELIMREEYSPILKKNPIKIINGVSRFFKLRKWKKINIKKKPQYIKKFVEQNSINVYGSDEIWNFENPFFGYDDFFFGKFDHNKKISYAASFGTVKKNNFHKKKIFDEIKTNLKKFSFLSVRDENSWKLLKNEFKLNSEIVLDPTFLIENTENKDGLQSTNKTCLLYGNYFSKTQIDSIIKYCRLNKLKLLSVGYYNKWAKSNITINPFEFIRELKNSEMVITSMFHGVQLAVKYKKNFWFSVDPYRFNKLEYFIKKLNLENRNIEEHSISKNEIDYIKIYEKMNNWKKFSRDFLLNSIKILDN